MRACNSNWDLMMTEITIKDSKIVEGKLSTSIKATGGLDKYFGSTEFYANYDLNIHIDESIQNIPLTATILPLAWLTGSNIYVNKLDKKFFESIEFLKNVFKEMYPSAPFSTEIIAEEIVENEIQVEDSERRTGLLFSGGVDSVFSLLDNRHLNPRLIMIKGVEIGNYEKYDKYWENVVQIYKEFSIKEKVILNVVETNAREILNIRKVEQDFHKLLKYGTLWARLQHSLVLIPLTAPLSFGRFDRLLISATHDSTLSYSRHPWGSQPIVDENIRWANVKVEHVSFIPRNEKIRGAIKKYLENDRLNLRVCTKRERLQGTNLNCNACEKCYRTILPLILAGINVRDCGFEVNETTFQSIREFIEDKQLDIEGLEAFWLPLQKEIPSKFQSEILGATEFFEWYKNLDLKSYQANLWFYRDVYYKLPYKLAMALDILYKKFNINIHEHSPIRPK